MSGPTEIETMERKTGPRAAEDRRLDEVKLKAASILPGFDAKSLVMAVDSASPLRAAHKPSRCAGDARRNTLAVQEQWCAWLDDRERLKSEIRRGQECLAQAQRELAELREQLEEWPIYENVCGRNPLADYMQALTAKEQIGKFLPVWLKRRERQLQEINRKLERRARQQGWEHLLWNGSGERG
jgi:hypothetical protein